MKYSWKFKKECVKKYKMEVKISNPDYSNCDSVNYSKQVLNQVKLFDAHGVNGLKHKSSNKDWNQEEIFELVAKVLAGNSLNSVAYEAGINSGLLCSWIKNYKRDAILAHSRVELLLWKWSKVADNSKLESNTRVNVDT